MNILTITSLFPNSVQTRHGIFVETRMRKYKEAYQEHNVDVVAPVPFFPIIDRFVPSRKKLHKIPSIEQRNGFQVFHPRYLSIPGLGMYTNPFFLFFSLLWFYLTHRELFSRSDVLDVHYFYPDGFAAVALAKIIKKPTLVTARGNDISLLPSYKFVRTLIKWTIKNSTKCAGVCKALTEEMQQLVPTRNDYIVLRNGVDLDFFVTYSEEERRKLRIERNLDDKYVIICVGHFIERKGQYLVIDAIKDIENVHLLLAGDGEMENELRKQVKDLKIEHKVQFLGHRTPSQLVEDFNVADISILASSREGWANVLLESMACGTRVIATAIWGTPEVIKTEIAGNLIQKRSIEDIRKSILNNIYKPKKRIETHKYTKSFSWDDSIIAINKTFMEIKD